MRPKCSRQGKDWPCCHHMSPITSPWLRLGRKASPAPSRAAGTLFPPVHTVGEQVVLLQRAERVRAPKARLPRQRGVTKAVLGSRRDGRLELLFVPGGFTPTCKTGHNKPWVPYTFTQRYFAWLAMSQHCLAQLSTWNWRSTWNLHLNFSKNKLINKHRAKKFFLTLSTSPTFKTLVCGNRKRQMSEDEIISHDYVNYQNGNIWEAESSPSRAPCSSSSSLVISELQKLPLHCWPDLGMLYVKTFTWWLKEPGLEIINIQELQLRSPGIYYAQYVITVYNKHKV